MVNDYKSFVNSIFAFKSRLVLCNSEKLSDYYRSLEEYSNSLDIIICLILTNPGFLVLESSILSKIIYIVNLNRFSKEIDSNDKEKIDFIISFANRLENADISLKEQLRATYLKDEAQKRGVKKLDAIHLMILTQYDAEIMDCLVNGKEIPIDLSHNHMLSFVNYLVEDDSSFFRDADFCATVLKRISEIKEASGVFEFGKKRNIKELVKKISCVMWL